MNLREFKSLLHQHEDLNIRFRAPNDKLMSAHAHVTEVARIDKRFIDCGGKLRTEAMCRLQLWVAKDFWHRLKAGTLLAILNKAEPLLGSDELDMDVEYGLPAVTQSPVETVAVADGELVVNLLERHTACLAREKSEPRKRRFPFLFRLGLLLFCSSYQALAWGPHPAITQAALDALGPNDALVRHLGAQAQRLTNYAWMADYRNLIFEEPGEAFYANDFLLFPEAPEHWDHICPEVKKTYRPYFMRALQALRTETPTNAARWIGSLLHFIEDTGSPPHAGEIRGALHSKMENWVDARKIHISGYAPQNLGTTEEDAMKGLMARMDGLIEFSKERARKIRFGVEIGSRPTVEPLVLECALETSRVTADLLHTLGQFIGGSNDLCTLRGVAVSRDPQGTERFPVKIVIAGTSWSTFSDLDGRFEFRNLPAGERELIAFRPGNGTLRQKIDLKPGNTTVNFELPTAPANLIRNGNFGLKWVRADAPDCWIATKTSLEGEVIPLKLGQRYRLTATFRSGMDCEVVARFAKPIAHALPRFATMPKFENRTLNAKENTWEFTANESLGLLQMSLHTRGEKAEYVLESVSLVALP
jgi:hypothetical protein